MEKENISTKRKSRYAKYLRNFIFGVEDSLVSSVGVLSGVAVVGTSTKTIVLAGVVLIFVEAFSMGVGSLLSENVAKEFREGKEVPIRRSLVPSLIMFFSYFFAGFIPLSPYIFLNPDIAFQVSIVAALTALLILGMVSARLTGREMLRHGIEMFVIGGTAIGLGVLVGTAMNDLG